MSSHSSQSQQLPIPNSLINQGGENAIYIGAAILVIVIVLVIGLLSRRLEYAIIFSIALAAVLVLFALLT